MHRLISFLSSIFRSLLCCLFLLSSVALAQTQPPSSTPPAAESKLKYINKIGHWVSAYMMSGPEFMYTERNRFKSSAFTEVYIEPLFDTDVWMFAMLNKVTLARYPDLEKQTPHVILQVKFKPTSELFNSYSVKLVVQFSDQIKLDADKVADEANAVFQATYLDPAAARIDVQRAIAAALNSIATKLGKSLAPDLLVRYNGEVFWNGHTLHILPFEGNYVELEAIGKDLQPLPADEISWINADAFQSKAVVNLTGTGSKSVTLSQGNESMMVTLRRMSLNVDFHELLKKFIVEALSTQKRAAVDTLVYLRRDSVANEARIRDYIAYLERGNFPMEAGGAQVAMFSTPLVRPDSLTMQDTTRHADIARSLLALKRQKKLKAVMRRKLNVAALADLLVDQPERVKELIDDLLRQSGSLVARLVLNTSSDSRANEARNLVVDYLNKNIDQITGKYYPPSATTDPPLIIPRAGNPPVVFDAKKYLYVSAQANFAGKDELVAYLNDYLPKLDTPMYVFINYSHDTSVESYLARSPGARPVGLPEGARYKVFTVLHMPGSLLENVIGEGSTSATTVKESIEERVRDSDNDVDLSASTESFPDATTPCTTAQITKLQQDFEARLAGKKFRIYGGGMEMYGFDGYQLETGHKNILAKAGICSLSEFDATFKYVLNDPAHDIVRDVDIIYSTVTLWDGLQAGYNDGSIDWTSFVVPRITNASELDNELNRLEAVVDLARQVLPPGVVSEASYSNIDNYIRTCREQPTLALASKFHLEQTIKGIYVGLHCYANYTYSFADLKVRPAIKASNLMWPDVQKAEQEGFAVPLSAGNNYTQYLAQYNTDKAYFLGEQYLAMKFLVDMLVGMKNMFASLGTSWRAAINKQARLKMQQRRTELDALKGEVKRGEVVNGQPSPIGATVLLSLSAEVPSGTFVNSSKFNNSALKINPPANSKLKQIADDVKLNGDVDIPGGSKTEEILNILFMDAGYIKLDGKVGGNQGLDGLHIKGTAKNPTEIIVSEAKQWSASGGVYLSSANVNTALPVQMSDAWIRNVAGRLQQAGKKEVADMLLNPVFSNRISKYLIVVNKTTGEINILKLGTY